MALWWRKDTKLILAAMISSGSHDVAFLVARIWNVVHLLYQIV